MTPCRQQHELRLPGLVDDVPALRAIARGADTRPRRGRSWRQKLGPPRDDQDRRIGRRRPEHRLIGGGQRRPGREIATPIVVRHPAAEARPRLVRPQAYGKELGKVRRGADIPRLVLRWSGCRKTGSGDDLANAMCPVSSTQPPVDHAQVELTTIPGAGYFRKIAGRHRAMPQRHHDGCSDFLQSRGRRSRCL